MAYTGKKPTDHTDVTQSQSMTVTDDLTVDTNTLYVDSTNDRVGINDATPSEELDINGDGSDVRIRMYDGAGASVGRIEHSGANFDISNTATSTATMTFTTGSGSGSERMRIDSSGRVGIGTSSPAVELHINDASGLSAIRLTGGASGADNFQIMQGVTGVSNSGLSIYDIDATATRMTISSTGDVTITGDSNAGYLAVPQAYIGTTSSAVNMHILSSGVFLRSTSSGRYKTGVEDAEMSYAEELYNLRPVYYKSLSTFDNPDHSHWGFIAEEVAEIDPRLCLFKTTEPELDDDGNIQRDDDGNIVETTLDEPVVEGVQYDRMIPLLLMLLKAEKDKVETLETKVATLETQNADFETRLTALEAE